MKPTQRAIQQRAATVQTQLQDAYARSKTDSQLASRTDVEVGINSLEKKVYNPNALGL